MLRVNLLICGHIRGIPVRNRKFVKIWREQLKNCIRIPNYSFSSKLCRMSAIILNCTFHTRIFPLSMSKNSKDLIMLWIKLNIWISVLAFGYCNWSKIYLTKNIKWGSRQILGTISENEILQKLEWCITFKNKICSPKLDTIKQK